MADHPNGRHPPATLREWLDLAHSGGVQAVFRQFLGKSRRFFYSAFGNGYVARQLDRRQGDCRRCGACCKLLFNCPFLDESTTRCRCRIYGHTSRNCQIFPLDKRDLVDRDMVMPKIPCGYYFSDSGNGDPGDNGRGHTGPK